MFRIFKILLMSFSLVFLLPFKVDAKESDALKAPDAIEYQARLLINNFDYGQSFEYNGNPVPNGYYPQAHNYIFFKGSNTDQFADDHYYVIFYCRPESLGVESKVNGLGMYHRLTFNFDSGNNLKEGQSYGWLAYEIFATEVRPLKFDGLSYQYPNKKFSSSFNYVPSDKLEDFIFACNTDLVDSDGEVAFQSAPLGIQSWTPMGQVKILPGLDLMKTGKVGASLVALLLSCILLPSILKWLVNSLLPSPRE